MKHIVAKNQTQLPDCQSTARKSLFDVILLILLQTDFFRHFNYTVFFAKTCIMTVKENSQKLGTLPLTVLKILLENTD